MKTEKTFIDCLDNFKKKNECNYYDILNILHLSNIHFIENHYYQPNFSGNTIFPQLEPSKKIRSEYSHFANSKITPIGNYVEDLNKDYDKWKKQHEIDIQDVPELEVIHVKTKTKMTIETEIKTIDDLLRIIETNVYSDEFEYNIDLKSLSTIKNDLIQLNSMIGMGTLKESILNQLLYFMQDLHMTNAESDFKHTVICGPPGTGKTEIAKIIGNMYSKLGILKNNTFKKVTRNDLIAGYLGQTAIKTRKVIDECLGGVLFIDEAYSLASSKDDDIYSKECIDILCDALSSHKDELMVIIAGYENELNETFFRVNRGIESRFIWRFKIDDYKPKELMEIFKKKVKDTDWVFDNESDVKEKWFDEKKMSFKNYGRDMEILFSYVKIAHSRRIYGKDISLRKRVSAKDLNVGYEIFIKNKKIETDSFNKLLETIYI
jgi:hypothetical protein